LNVTYVKPSLGIECGVTVAQPPTTAWNDTDTTPRTVGNGKDISQHLFSGNVTFRPHSSLIRIFKFSSTLFKLQNYSSDTL
jgi:hypothetical protein